MVAFKTDAHPELQNMTLFGRRVSAYIIKVIILGRDHSGFRAGLKFNDWCHVKSETRSKKVM
jgi:hypothetical protein